MAIKFKGDTSVAVINSIKKAEVDTVYRCFDFGVLLSNEVINHGDFVSWDGTKWIKRSDLSYLINNAEHPIEQQIENIVAVIPEGTTEENPLVNETGLGEVAERVTTAEGDIDSIEEKIPSGASSSNKLVTESDLEAAQDSWQSGFTPKGEATVSQIDALTTQSNGDQYIVTDSGTITAGSVAVVAGDTVAWNATDEVWYKVTQYAKASEQAALTTYAQNVSSSIAPLFDPTRDSEHAYPAGYSVTYTDGKVYKFTAPHYGAWTGTDVEEVSLQTDVISLSADTDQPITITKNTVVEGNGHAIDISETLALEFTDDMAEVAHDADSTSVIYKVFVSHELPLVNESVSRPYNYVTIWGSDSSIDDCVNLTPKLTVEEVEETDNSFTYDGTKFVVHCSGNATKTFKLLPDSGFCVNASGCKVVLRNLKCVGGWDHCVQVESGEYEFDNCEFCFSKTGSTVRLKGSFGVCRNCVAHHSNNDGYGLNDGGNNELICCKGLYCNDDGVSHHSDTGALRFLVDGGEWAYNGKAGVASPVYSSHGEVRNAYIHDNRYGVYTDATVAHPAVPATALVANNVFSKNTYAARAAGYNLLLSNNVLSENTNEFSVSGGGSIKDYNNVRLPSGLPSLQNYLLQVVKNNTLLQGDYNNVITFESSSSGGISFPFLFLPGVTYEIENTGSASIAAVRTWNFDESVVDVVTENFAAGKIIKYTPSSEGYYLRVFSNNAFSLSIKTTSRLSEGLDFVTAAINSVVTKVDEEFVPSVADGVDYSIPVVKGIRYRITNNTSAIITARTKYNNTVVQVISEYLQAGKSVEFTASGNADVLRIYYNAANGSVSFESLNDYNSQIENVQGQIDDINGSLYKTDIDLTTALSSGVMIYSNGAIGSTISFKTYPNASYKSGFVKVNKNDIIVIKGLGGDSARLWCFTDTDKKSVAVAGVREELTSDKILVAPADGYLVVNFNGTVGNFAKRVSPYSQLAEAKKLSRFEINDAFANLHAFISDFDFSTTAARKTIMEQIYTKLDALVSSASSVVSRVDVAVEVDMSYPEYANGVETEGTYLVTPEYKTYAYKLSFDAYCNTHYGLDSDGLRKKKKLMIVSGLHGNEIFAPVAVTALVDRLVNDRSDVNLMRLLSAFDIYVVPCLNGYGMYHLTRDNANGVNLNRNFEADDWKKSGSPGDDDYTGETYNSEFETQLIEAYVELIKPDMFYDVHNYAWQSNMIHQWETQTSCQDILLESYKSLSECTAAFMKNLPQYFGTLPLYIGLTSSVVCPNGIENEGGRMAAWAYYYGKVAHDANIELSESINFDAGSPAASAIDRFGENSLMVAEYTLRSQILRYGNLAL